MSTSLKDLMDQDAARPVSPAPIDDVLAGGQARLRRRRVLTVVAAVLVAGLAIAVPIGLVGGDSSVDEPVKHPERSDSLTFTREDGTIVTIDGARVHCPLPSETETETQAILVLARGKGGTYFMIEAPLDEVADGATVELPASFEGAAHLFVADAADTNELATNKEGASGTLVFESASCDPTPAIDVRIDATLASEFSDRGPARVDGRITLGYED